MHKGGELVSEVNDHPSLQPPVVRCASCGEITQDPPGHGRKSRGEYYCDECAQELDLKRSPLAGCRSIGEILTTHVWPEIEDAQRERRRIKKK
jgi:hypothetical protein